MIEDSDSKRHELVDVEVKSGKRYRKGKEEVVNTVEGSQKLANRGTQEATERGNISKKDATKQANSSKTEATEHDKTKRGAEEQRQDENHSRPIPRVAMHHAGRGRI